MAEDDHQAPVNAIDDGADAVLDEAAAVADDSTLPLAFVNPPELERSRGKKGKGKRKKKKERKSKALPSSPTAAIPLSIALPSPTAASEKRKRRRPKGFRDKPPFRFRVKIKVRDKLFPHFITVNPGEDVISVMTEFNQAYPHRNVSIVSAAGTASKAVFDNSTIPRTYEGRLELISLSGGYTIVEGNADSRNHKEGKLSALLSKDNGVLIGGTLVGPLIAADPINIILGSYRKIIKKAKKPNNVLISSIANLNIDSASKDVVDAPEDMSANLNRVSEDSTVDL